MAFGVFLPNFIHFTDNKRNQGEGASAGRRVTLPISIDTRRQDVLWKVVAAKAEGEHEST